MRHEQRAHADMNLQGERRSLVIVASRFNQSVVSDLLESCLAALAERQVREENIRTVWVPGAFEIPLAAAAACEAPAQEKVDAVITLGVIIRGETPHFDIIAQECARGIGQVALDTGVPVIFGVLTVDSMEQAKARSAKDERNKGAEAALAALEMIAELQRLREER